MEAIRAAKVWRGGAFEDDAALLIEGGVIREVGDPRSFPPGTDVTDWGHVAIVPGTVNCHGHAFQNLFKGVADDLPFERWRDDVLYPLSAGLDRNAVYTGALFAFAEALAAGVTTTVDFFYLHDAGNANADAVLEAARDAGIRLVMARSFYDVDAPTKAPPRYREPAAEARERLLDLARRHRGEDRLAVQPAAHSLHAATPETIRIALEMAEQMDAPCHLHLAEASYEVDQVRERFGRTPARLLHDEGLLSERLVAVHGVWLDDEELDLFASSGAALVHCPGANAFLGDGVARLPEMLARGIRVGLGPDGGCANNRQSVFDEMRQASLMAKARLRDGAAVDAATMFRLGTASGGDVLDLPVGELAPGQAADLVALDLTDLSLQPLETLDRHIVNSMQATAIARVMVAGEVVAENGRPTRIDTVALREEISGIVRSWRRPG